MVLVEKGAFRSLCPPARSNGDRRIVRQWVSCDDERRDDGEHLPGQGLHRLFITFNK
jgi:hypothetical protein